MTVGNPNIFAIESRISQAYERLSFRALGYFVIHVRGHTYGRRSPDSTMLACSFDAVERRIAERGKHIAPFAGESDAGRIASSVREAVYGGRAENTYFGLSREEFCDLIYGNSI